MLALVFTGFSLGQVFFWDVDRCLDAGGAFDYNDLKCNGAPGGLELLIHGGGTLQLWIIIVLFSAAATFILDSIWRKVTRRG
jgi:hypothetical protein